MMAALKSRCILTRNEQSTNAQSNGFITSIATYRIIFSKIYHDESTCALKSSNRKAIVSFSLVNRYTKISINHWEC